MTRIASHRSPYRRVIRIFGLKLSSRKLTALALTVALLAPIATPALAQAGKEVSGAPGPGKVAYLFNSFMAALSAKFAGPQNGQGHGDGMPPASPSSPGVTPRRPPTKAEREAKVSKLEVNVQGEATLEVGEMLMLTAIPLDADGNAIHGLTSEWESSDTKVVSITPHGHAKAVSPGIAEVTASAGRKKAKIKVTVVAKTASSGNQVKRISTSSIAGKLNDQGQATPHRKDTPRASGRDLQISRLRLYAHAARSIASPQQPPPPAVSNPDGIITATNAVGAPPGKTTPGATTRAAATKGTETPGSSNFTFSVPVANLPGRGIDVGLSLVYNSRLWNKSGASITYNYDQGWPAPGFRLGYGSVKKQPSDASYTLTEPDGTRHQLVDESGDPQLPSYVYDSQDGTYIHATSTSGHAPVTVTFPDGTQIIYGASPNLLTSLPTQITDRNGNFITISYVGGYGPNISTIQDTMGRYVRFYYAANNDLVAVTAPGIGGGADRQVMRFYYQDIPLTNQSNLFQSLTVNGPATAHVIHYVYLSDSVESSSAHIGYRYDYSAYGMIYQVTQFRGMTVSTTTDLSNTGSVSTEGTVAAQTVYSYPTTPSNLSDAPTYTARTDDWAGRTASMGGGAPYYTFSVDQVNGISTVTAPDGTVTETHSAVHPGYADDGSIKEVIIKNQSGTIYSDIVYTWESGGDGVSQRLHQVQISNDAAAGDPNKTRAIVYEYDTTTYYDNVSKVHEYGFAPAGTLGTELRRTETSYVTSSTYLDRGLLRLPSSVKVYSGTTLTAETDYAYDETSLAADPGIIMYTDPATTARGNLTTVKTYPDTTNLASFISHTSSYDVAGNALTVQVDCCQQKSFTYSSSYYYAYPTSVTRGSGPTLTSSISYDFNTALTGTTTDENSQQTTYSYSPDSLRLLGINYPDGGQLNPHYGDNLTADSDGTLHYFINVTTRTDASGYIDHYQFFDGRGAVARTFKAYTTTNHWEAQDIQYDVMGRAYRKGNPYYSGGYGDPAGINPTGLWTTVTNFDALGRATSVTMPTGDAPSMATSTVSTSYSGTYTTITDQAGKQRRQVTDALGRVVRLDEPDGTGNLGATNAPVQPTYYDYNVLDNLIHIGQGAQNRYFKYDSMGRLTYERQVEQDAPYALSDPLTSNNNWSRQYVYNSQSFLTDINDARSFNTHFTPDGLNRVYQITYSDGVTPMVTYTYDQAHTGFYNLGRLTQITTGPVATPQTTTQYDYDMVGRVTSHKEQIGAAAPYTMSYTYNYAGELTSETYPSGRVMNYGYDMAGKLSQITDGTSAVYDNGFTYGAQEALTSETFGNGAIDARTYNNRLQLSQIKLTLGGTEQQRYDYQYGTVNADGSINTTNNTGQVGRIDGSINGVNQWAQTYNYDTVGRLYKMGEYQQANMSQLTYQAYYDYDRYGNRYQYENNSNVGYITVQTTDVDQTRNRFISTGATPVTYDQAGNITQDLKFRGMNYQYDANGRQTSATRTDGTEQQTAVYDGVGQRVQTSANSVTRQIVYDAFGQDIAEYSGGALERENIYRMGQLLATNEAATTCYKTITQFVQDFYQGVLARQPNSTELQQWTNSLTRAQEQGQDQLLGQAQSLGTTLFTSQEYLNRGRDNTGFVTDLYWGYLQRAPDSGGLSFWTGQVATYGRDAVRQSFATSGEFANNVSRLCVTTGVGGGLKYVLQDNAGSTRVVMSGGQIVARHDYLPYGEEIWSGVGLRSSSQGYGATDKVRQRYGSVERDDTTGLDHTWWRKYDSWAGRWTSADPYKGSMRIVDPQSFNRYSYVQNDPVNFVDPSGLKTECVDTDDGQHICFEVEDAVQVYDEGDGTPLVMPRSTIPRPSMVPQKIKVPKARNATPNQQSRFAAAYEELLRRLMENGGDNPCAKLFGGLKNAEKKLDDTHFGFGPTRNSAASAETNGNKVTINPNKSFMDTSGSVNIQVDVSGHNFGEGRYVTLNDVEAAAFALAHELGHRTGKLIDDGNDPLSVLSILNNGTVQRACFGEAPLQGPGRVVP